MLERSDPGADTGPDGAGIHAGEENPPVPLRPPGPAAGADKPGGRDRLVGRI